MRLLHEKRTETTLGESDRGSQRTDTRPYQNGVTSGGGWHILSSVGRRDGDLGRSGLGRRLSLDPLFE